MFRDSPAEAPVGNAKSQSPTALGWSFGPGAPGPAVRRAHAPDERPEILLQTIEKVESAPGFCPVSPDGDPGRGSTSRRSRWSDRFRRHETERGKPTNFQGRPSLPPPSGRGAARADERPEILLQSLDKTNPRPAFRPAIASPPWPGTSVASKPRPTSAGTAREGWLETLPSARLEEPAKQASRRTFQIAPRRPLERPSRRVACAAPLLAARGR